MSQVTGALPDPPATPAWNFACPDWKERLADGRTLVPDLPIDEKKAEQAVRIFNKIRLPDVEDMPPLSDACGEWFRDIVRAVFGSLDDDGVRHVPEVFCLVPKKNSKTTYSAALMIVALLLNRRPKARFIFCGPTIEIADIAFSQAQGMIEADPFLSKRFKVQAHIKTITDLGDVTKKTKGSTLRVQTFSMDIVTGAPPAGVLLDEIHIMSKNKDAARIIGQLRGGMLPKPESFLVMITTQSDVVPTGVFKSELDYARKVRDAKNRNPHNRLLPILYEFPLDMQADHKNKRWADPRNWPMITPNLGRSITIDRLVAEFEQAKEKGDEEERRWASQHLNVQMGVAYHADRWRGVDYWEGAVDEELRDLDKFLARCEVVVVGVDGGGLDDLYGLSLAGRDEVNKDWLYWFRAWAQDEAWNLRPQNVGAFEGFAKDGDLIRCEYPTQDIVEIADIIAKVADEGLLPEKDAIGLDPLGVAALVEELEARDLDNSMFKSIRQGYALSSAVWGMERKLKDATIWHGGSPFMAWVVSNARYEQRGNAGLITKEVAGRAKIDPLIAGFNATKLLERGPVAHSYVTGGVVTA